MDSEYETLSEEKDKGRREVTSYCDWMSKQPAELHKIPLFHLAIPGSHDSMAYDLDINSSIVEPDRLKPLSHIYCARKIVRKWATTQEETITKQLDAGARYFDLRIARKPNDTNPTRLYFYHGLYTRTDVETVLTDINEWAEKHPKEILILALSHFKGFDKTIEEQLHNHLINFIKTLFGAKLIPRKGVPSMKSCWDQGRTVLISYDHRVYQHPEIWNKITYYYGKSMNPAKVESKLHQDLEKARPPGSFFVCGLNLTLPEDSRALCYVLRLCDSLASVTRRRLPRLLRWVKGKAGNTPLNIVASDLVTCDDFVPTIIELNASRYVKP